MEQLYEDMMASYDIQGAGHKDTLIMICKTSLKANQLIDMGDIEGFQKMSKVYDTLMKSGKFTAAQNKAEAGEYVDSISELVLMFEKDGFIPRYYVETPQDKVDYVIQDMQEYTHTLITEEMHLGALIEKAVQKIEEDRLKELEDEIDDVDEEEAFDRRSIAGFCDGYIKEIVVCDMHTYKGWEHDTEKTIVECQKETIRHEIVHAFFYESGLWDNSFGIDNSWAKNEEMVDYLNKFQPKIICTYVSTIEALAKEQMKGTLRLNLKEVFTGGETLSQKTREHIESVFGCKMRSMYASTEASGIALDCNYGHLHLHNDSLIVEPVDENNNPVPVGEKSHKILITSLYERTVPLIRYEVSDKVTIHNTPCKCGNKSPWVEVEGRSVEPPFIFKNMDGEVAVSTFMLFVKTMGMPNVRKIQLILRCCENLIFLYIIYGSRYEKIGELSSECARIRVNHSTECTWYSAKHLQSAK